MLVRGRLLILICLLGLTAGRTAGEPAFAERSHVSQSDEALVYLYRLHYPGLRNSYPDVYVNGEQRGSLKDEGHLVYRLRQGKATIEVKGNGVQWPRIAASVTPILQPERTYFFKYTAEQGFVGTELETRVRLEEMPREQAIKDLQTTRLSN